MTTIIVRMYRLQESVPRTGKTDPFPAGLPFFEFCRRHDFEENPVPFAGATEADRDVVWAEAADYTNLKIACGDTLGEWSVERKTRLQRFLKRRFPGATIFCFRNNRRCSRPRGGL